MIFDFILLDLDWCVLNLGNPKKEYNFDNFLQNKICILFYFDNKYTLYDDIQRWWW